MVVKVGDTVPAVLSLCAPGSECEIYIHEDPTHENVQLLQRLRDAAATTDTLVVRGWASPLRPEFVSAPSPLPHQPLPYPTCISLGGHKHRDPRPEAPQAKREATLQADRFAGPFCLA